jgi:4-amino-4-deoxy-L-arabinose transferase-like glycosyltransferase
VSKNKSRQVSTASSAVQQATVASVKDFAIPYPQLLLVAAVLLVYFPVFSFGYTELDDTIFIKEFRVFNEELHNIIVAFSRGLFDAVKDPYYRPLFSVAMILNYQFSGDLPTGYHFINVLLHIASVLLLYRLFARLGLKSIHGFLLALIFAVHPVLSQAVAWIPGRNDTMLAVFVLSFFINSIDYTAGGEPRKLIWAGLFLLLAFFTKETAVFAAPAAFAMLVLYKGIRWNDQKMYSLYIVWIVCFGVWYAARSAATIQSAGIGTSQTFSDLVHRLPVVLQYLGKVLLPFNLSVFPTQQDTVMYYGLIAHITLLVLVLTNRKANKKAVVGGGAVFLMFLMPALLVPDELNRQTFEHRLYLPIIGILLILPQTILFSIARNDKQLTYSILAICTLFAGINYAHQRHFESPVSFWSQAAATSPNSAYAVMMLAARLDKSEIQRSEQMFRHAYELNPKEKYLNFYLAEMLQRKDSVLASEQYLLAEKKISDYIQCDFYLARVAIEKRDPISAIGHLQQYLKRDRNNPMANNNLLLLYTETNQPDKAKQQALNMLLLGLDVPINIRRQFGI